MSTLNAAESFVEYDAVKLNNMRDVIERMSKFNQIEVLRILSKYKEIINENKYGINVNLSELSDEILREISMYIQYVNTQEIVLSETELEKESYKTIYFVKDNKNSTSNYSNRD